MKGLLGAIAILLVLTAAVAWFAPATLVDQRIAASTDRYLRLADAQGTIWQGRGALMPVDGSWRVPVAWRLAPLPLLRRVVDVELIERGRVAFAPDSVTIGGFRANVPARVLAILAGNERVSVGGEIAFHADTLTLAREGSAGSAVAEWRNARLALPDLPAIDLGTITATLMARPNALAGPITNRGGDIAVSGDLELASGSVRANLRLRPAASASEALRNAVAALGPAEADGTIVVRVQRDLR